VTEPIKSPFVWFGGKRRVAAEVWAALGDVDNYVEPFAGSLAVLLGRPHNLADGQRRAETTNDADGFLSNFWRAVSKDPAAVAYHADYPVNEVDLFARHLWLVNDGRSALLNGLEADPEFYDAKIAGWWVWGVNAWIGSGWCAGTGPWMADKGVIGKLPHLGTAGQGVKRQLPHLGDAGQGVNRKRPHLGDAGQGVNRQLPHLGDAGRAGYNNLATKSRIADYFYEIAERLRDVRVCCGDWSRVVTRGALTFGATVGVFLDPPYGDVRTADLYAVDDLTVSAEVRSWCLANGDDPRLRIVLAGYSSEHDAFMPDTWTRYRYSASAAYQTHANKGGQNEANRHNEVLWLSPACVKPSAQGVLFTDASDDVDATMATQSEIV
jgi:site-specific DNA-adenine methylase